MTAMLNLIRSALLSACLFISSYPASAGYLNFPLKTGVNPEPAQSVDFFLDMIKNPGGDAHYFYAFNFTILLADGTQPLGGYVGPQANHLSNWSPDKQTLTTFSIWVGPEQVISMTPGPDAQWHQDVNGGEGTVVNCGQTEANTFALQDDHTYVVRLARVDKLGSFQASIVDLTTQPWTETIIGTIQIKNAVAIKSDNLSHFIEDIVHECMFTEYILRAPLIRSDVDGSFLQAKVVDDVDSWGTQCPHQVYVSEDGALADVKYGQGAR